MGRRRLLGVMDVHYPMMVSQAYTYDVCAHSVVSDSWNPTDCNSPGSSVYGTPQARILEQVAIPFSRRSSWPGDRTRVSLSPCIGRWVLYHQHYLGCPFPPPGSFIYEGHDVSESRTGRGNSLGRPWERSWSHTETMIDRLFSGPPSLPHLGNGQG